jgi:hypothetical protein
MEGDRDRPVEMEELYTRIVKALVSSGADPCELSTNGDLVDQLPSEIAEAVGRHSMAGVLREFERGCA